MYKYITDNNLESDNRQNYMYSEYGGEAFLDAYYKTRKAFIDKHHIDVSENEMHLCDVPKDNVTAVALYSLAKNMVAGKWNALNKETLDYYVKAFEIRKRLYSEYEPNSFRPVENAQYDCIINYVLLACCTVYGYRLTDNLKYLNTLLKLNDTLLSIAEGNNKYNNQVNLEKLGWLLVQELTFVKQNGNLDYVV